MTAPLSAQSVGRFKGILIDKRGKKVSKASVTVEGVKGKRYSQKLVTNKSGKFEVDLPAGSYQITITKPGFMVLTLTAVEIEANTRCTHEFLLPFAEPTQTTH